MPKLILFDIDGTLICTGGAGGRAMTKAFEHTCGITEALERVEVAGRTDSIIMADAFNACGRTMDADVMGRVRDVYCVALRDELTLDGFTPRGELPGIRPLLDTLAVRPDVSLALLTGNFRQSAEIKLAQYDLWRYFPWGAFGEEAFDRHDLLPVALERHRAAGGAPLAPADVVIIGDTPHDVSCALRGGARVIAVATGHFSTDQLRASGATHVFADLGDTPAVLAALDASS